MTVALRASAEADALVVAPQRPAAEERADAADMLEELIASHRAALRELAPHQEDRAARVETGWHMEHLGVLLCLRDAACRELPPHPACDALRAGQAARIRAALAYRAAGRDPVEELTTLLPLPANQIPDGEENPAPSGVHLPERGRTRENTGADRRPH